MSSGEYSGLPNDQYFGPVQAGQEIDLILRKIWAQLAAANGVIPFPYGGNGGGGPSGVSQGQLRAVSGTGSPVELAGRPSVTSGVTVYVGAGASFEWFIGTSGQTYANAPDGNSVTFNPTDAQSFDIPTSGSDAVFVISADAGTLYRFVFR